MAALLAQDRYLPRQMAWLGDRLVFQNGIGLLLLVSALVIVVCRGNTNVAINLYALGVFLAFTLSQAGLVRHWWSQRGPGWRGRLVMNALGAITTGLVFAVIVLSNLRGRLDRGAVAALLVWGLGGIGRRYKRVYAAIELKPGEDISMPWPVRQDVLGIRASSGWRPGADHAGGLALRRPGFGSGDWRLGL